MSDTFETSAGIGPDTQAPTAAQAPAHTSGQTGTDTPAPTPGEADQQAGLPTGNAPGTSSRFGRSLRCGLAAAAIVVVAGAFFTIGWFTSTRGDYDGPFERQQISRQMNRPTEGFRQGDARRHGHGQWQRQGYPQGQSQEQPLTPGRPGQQTPTVPETPSAPNIPSAPQTPPGQQAPSTPQAPSAPQTPSIPQGYLGITVTTVTEVLQERYDLSRSDGVLVAFLDRRGPAFQAGIRRGDIITSIDGTPIATQQQLIDLVAKKNTGDAVSLVIDRDGRALTFEVTLAARPDAVSG